MTDKIANLVATRPWPIIIGFLLISLAFGSRIPATEVDPEMKNQLNW